MSSHRVHGRKRLERLVRELLLASWVKVVVEYVFVFVDVDVDVSRCPKAVGGIC